MTKIHCAHCGRSTMKPTGSVNRSLRIGAPVYCGKECAGLARRTEKPPLAVRRAAKAAYDRARRKRLGDRIKAAKAAYFQRTYYTEAGQRKARAVRKKNMARHVAYCRRLMSDPQKRAAKVAYDLERRAITYGDFAEAWKLLLQLERAVRQAEPSQYLRRRARGCYDRQCQQRKRDAQISRW